MVETTQSKYVGPAQMGYNENHLDNMAPQACAGPVQTSPVYREMQICGEAIEELGMIIEGLSERLQPLIRDEPTCSDAKVNTHDSTDGRSSMVNAIALHTERVRMHTTRLKNLLSTLDI